MMWSTLVEHFPWKMRTDPLSYPPNQNKFCSFYTLSALKMKISSERWILFKTRLPPAFKYSDWYDEERGSDGSCFSCHPIFPHYESSGFILSSKNAFARWHIFTAHAGHFSKVAWIYRIFGNRWSYSSCADHALSQQMHMGETAGILISQVRPKNECSHGGPVE